ncbi:response regulator [Kibdelosporangium phytohabitans]|uniref:LuxR family transcriptional regulator n=1 Tax=Kibdelosporangium phytohabitans TaxID=860235 RepID=A0A0N9I803_9PSEU|nr:response regulator transcription factor [Kibdelosporangium phytohabitans]ALG10900.1 LuxR family transcriptional regulator [Kibdelosporangium phytohabitans]
MIRVMLVDDQPLLRASFRALLDSEPDITVVGEAADGRAAVMMAAQLKPDVALIDVQMPNVNGIEATKTIADNPDLAGIRVIILTNYALDEYVFAALRAGASGFLAKDSEPDELLRAVRTVANGDALLSPKITKRLIAEFVAHPASTLANTNASVLTKRETEVVRLVGMGMSNEEIASHMVISLTTAKTHVSRALSKTKARDRAQLVVFAYETGLVQPRQRDDRHTLP